MSFLFHGVLTAGEGLAYKPPIDAAPRFTGSHRCPLKVLIEFRCMSFLASAGRGTSVALVR
jgi:hypothetical protein